MNCSSRSRIWGISVCLITWLTFLLDDLDFRCVFDLLSHLAPFVWTLGCFLCIVILKTLGCFTSTGFTVGWTCVSATCSTIRCWILS